VSNAQIVALGVRLFSIWVVLYLFGHTPGLWTFVKQGNSQDAGAALVIAVVVILLLVAIGLWLFPLAVARKLLPNPTLDQPTALPVEQLERAGFCLLGLWMLTEAVPGLVHQAALFVISDPQGPLVLDENAYPYVAHNTAELLIGVWLLLGARGLLGVLRWARTAGGG
jgi:hypothetical protein